MAGKRYPHIFARDLCEKLSVGNISIETAGEASRLTIPDVDSPQSVADEILNRSQGLTTNR